MEKEWIIDDFLLVMKELEDKKEPEETEDGGEKE